MATPLSLDRVSSHPTRSPDASPPHPSPLTSPVHRSSSLSSIGPASTSGHASLRVIIPSSPSSPRTVHPTRTVHSGGSLTSPLAKGINFSGSLGAPLTGMDASAFSFVQPSTPGSVTARREEASREKTAYIESLRTRFAPLLVLPTAPTGLTSVSPIRVVGRAIGHTERAFYEVVKEAIVYAEDASTPSAIRELLVPIVVRGTYFFRSIHPDKRKLIPSLLEAGTSLTDFAREHVKTIAVFKPDDEVRGGMNSRRPHTQGSLLLPAKHGIRAESEVPNELIALGLRERSFGMEAMLTSKAFHIHSLPAGSQSTKWGFLMPFLPNAQDLSKLRQGPDGEALLTATIARFPQKQFEDLVITDLSLVNTDRHEDNFLHMRDTGDILPIDQALILPAQFLSPGNFAWMSWGQAFLPFSEAALRQIGALNFAEDVVKIRAAYPNYPLESLETMRIAYYLLQKGASEGLTPFQIACFLTGDPGTSIPNPLCALYAKSRLSAHGDADAAFKTITTMIDLTVGALKARSAELEKALVTGASKADSPKSEKDEMVEETASVDKAAMQHALEEFLRKFLTSRSS